MLNTRKVANFAEIVWGASARLGTRNAPIVADDILKATFPRTCDEAEIEGAAGMLRRGVIAEVGRILSHEDDPTQMDFSDIAEEFKPIVSRLGKRAYFVESRGEFVAVPALLQNLAELDDARKFMRRKGDECHAEAKVLDELYFAAWAAAAK